MVAIDRSWFNAPGYFDINLATGCGIYEINQLEFDPFGYGWEIYDTGAGSDKLCFIITIGTDGNPALIQFMNRTVFTNLSVLGTLTYRVVDIIV
jgi:hypothetical protein